MSENTKRGLTIKFDLVTVITAVIVVAWAASYAAEFFSSTFQAPSSLDPLMLLVASTYITKSAVQSQKEEPVEKPTVKEEEESK